jgi:hypothetical protein
VIVLDQVCEADIPAVVVACSDPETQRWLALESPFTAEIAREQLQRWQGRAERGEELNFAIRLNKNAELVA